MADNTTTDKGDWPPPMAPFFNDYVQAGFGTLLFALAFAVVLAAAVLVVERIRKWR